MQRLVSMPESGYMQMASGFMQLATTGCRRNIYYIVTVFLKENFTCALEWG